MKQPKFEEPFVRIYTNEKGGGKVWVSTTLWKDITDTYYVDFEIEYDDDEDTYCSGGIVLDREDTSHKTCLDYDGVYELPKYILWSLKEQGYNIDEIDCEED